MKVSTENATPPKSSKSKNPNFWVQIQSEPTSQFEFGPPDNEKFEFLDLMEFVDVAFSMANVMGWLPWVGSLKLEVFFAEYSLFYRALLQKRLIILRSLLIIATP